ncbi:hypothetical protein SSPO_039590 [Streptomyces antimycoticus]|uniref:Uncharacterized protein n=1 Tax=Streptomyces antimycoticus TaxID=68175 RepID=A0A499UVE2_9ACTN|nr:hypothetical protein SSPO_039590 [Streptomyces antimycoticus]
MNPGMTYIALEEAFIIPELAARQPGTPPLIRVSDRYAEQRGRGLGDIEEHRLPDMDAHGIDIQVLSPSAPGIQADTDAPTAVDNARFANDFLARTIARHPTRFRGFAALPLQDPAAAAAAPTRATAPCGARHRCNGCRRSTSEATSRSPRVEYWPRRPCTPPC